MPTTRVGEGGKFERGEGKESGTSIFDPVLAEIAYRWFCGKGARVLDCFAGGSVRGVVAAFLERQYFGIELRREQLKANEMQLPRIFKEGNIIPEYIEGDARNVLKLARKRRFDFLFTCPPYGDLERYSDDERDLSTLDYPEFLKAYRQVIADSCSLLEDDRFACIVVGDFRDRAGNYRGFVEDTVRAFQDAGLKKYNEAILVTAVGSLAIRVNAMFESGRKLGKTHQNILIFLKGNAKRAAEACGEVDIAAPDESFGEVITAESLGGEI